MNTVLECLYMFLVEKRGHQLSTYATVDRMEDLKLRTGGGCVTPNVYVQTYTISFHVFGIILVL